MTLCIAISRRRLHLAFAARNHQLLSHGAASTQVPVAYVGLRVAKRFFAATQVQTTTESGSLVKGGGVGDVEGPSALVGLAERGGLLPRPEVFDERLKPGFRGGRALFVFFLCNLLPFGSLLYYLREQRKNKTQLSLLALPTSAEDVAAEALRVIRTSSASFLQQSGTENGWTLRVDPHSPEGTAYIPPTEPLPLLPQVERNVLTDIFESPPVAGLGYIHFALSRASSSGARVLAGDRQASLLYISNTRGAYCSVSGQLSVLSDLESRRRYWKNIWALSFFAAKAEAPDESAREPSPGWENGDYLLVRLAVDDVTLHPVVDGPQRWEQRRVHRNPGTMSDDGPKWTLVAPQ